MSNKLKTEIDIINDLDTVDNVSTPDNINKIITKKQNNIDNFSNIVKSMNNILTSVSSELKILRNDIKKLTKIRNQEIKKITKIKNNNKNKYKTGFMKAKKIPDKLAKYLNLDKDTTMVRNDLVKIMYNKIRSEGMINNDDKRIFRPDDELIKIFGLNKEIVLNTNDPKNKECFSFFTLQKHLANLYNEEKKNIENNYNNDSKYISNNTNSNLFNNKDIDITKKKKEKKKKGVKKDKKFKK